MTRSKGLMWTHFDKGVKQNSSHYKALCHGCIEKNATATPVLGVEKSMVAHVLKCINASDAAKKLARKIKKGAKENGNTKKRIREEDTDSGDDVEENTKNPTKKRALHTDLISTEISLLRELDASFTDVQVEGIRAQFEKATVSAKFPDGWFENLEVIKLFKMINETARDATPSRQQVGGELLDEVDGGDEESDYEGEETDDEDEEADEVDDDHEAKLFESWYTSKSEIFQQALMQAMDIVRYPERVNQTDVTIWCQLRPDHKICAPADKYRLKSASIMPLESAMRSFLQECEEYQSTKLLDEQVKSNGQIGAIPVRMVDATHLEYTYCWWPLEIPYSTEEAQKILEDTKWGNVWWASRLRDILEYPESSYEFVGGHAKLPDDLLHATPMTDFYEMNTERFKNDPNCEFFDGNPRCDYTGRHIAFEKGNYKHKFNELFTRPSWLFQSWFGRNQSAGRLRFDGGILYRLPDYGYGTEAIHGVVSNRHNRVGSDDRPLQQSAEPSSWLDCLPVSQQGLPSERSFWSF
uniref:Uncharacterized protein n=1 Tax=Moniliophthora roreri TaxID=221103 RepID=A0A0W0FSA1_MONRR